MTETSDRPDARAETGVEDPLPGLDSAEAGARTDAAVEAALSRHLLAGRGTADGGQLVLAGLTLFIFWNITPAWMGTLWFLGFVATSGVRAVYRRRTAAQAGSTDEVRSLVRRDVWISAAFWGGWAVLHTGADVRSLAFLLLIFAGLVAAASSTMVADTRAFGGFTALLLGPLSVAVAMGDLTRDHVAMLLLIGLFAPFMLAVQRRAHATLAEQLRAGERLKLTEEETERRRDFLASLVASAPTPIVVLDGRGGVVRANPAFERVFGYQGGDVADAPFIDLVTDQESRAALAGFLDEVQEGRRLTTELLLRRGGGGDIWVRMSGTRALGSAEGFIVLVGEDVTEQVVAHEAQVKARIQAEEAARAKSVFLASMSHEIRTPMNGILGMIEILLDTPLTEEQQGFAEVIRASGQGLLRILNDVLDVSKIEAGQLDLEEVDYDLLGLVGGVARVFIGAATKAGNELLLDVGPNVPRAVRGDPHRLRQVLSNLVGNAVKFTANGEIVLSVRVAETEEERVRLRFGVRDTGIGIPAEKQDVIFREFEQADSSTTRTHGGTGLGLSISRRLVALMGGEIRLQSEAGKGSDFFFELEFSVGRDDRTADTRRPASVPLSRFRFLVVDDNATARRIVREALAHVGVTIVEADSVQAGLEQVRAAASKGAPFDVVILDHMMPERDGFDFMRAVTADAGLPPMRVLMMTSASLPGGAERARAEGIGGYMAKPVSRAELLQALWSLAASTNTTGPERRLVTRETLSRHPTWVRILLAEDNPVNQQVALTLLQKRGYQVVAVTDGSQAVEAVRLQSFDLVLMDIQMPVMDGLEAARQIRTFRDASELPVIALTAHAFAEERERSREAGMNDFLAKPFVPDDLYELVDKWTEGRQASAVDRKEKRAMASPDEPKAPVDLEDFRAIMREAGVEEVVETTVGIYLADAPAAFEEIQRAVTEGDPESIRKAAHSLKSASGNIRARRLAELLQEMENLGRKGDASGARERLPSLRAEYDAVMEYLQNPR